MAAFEANIRAWSKNTGLSIEETYRGACLTLFGLVIDDTPVDEGILRGNWQTDVGGSNDTFLQVKDVDGGIALAAAHSGLGAANETTHFYNNAPYAEAIEDGHSKNAPAGMLKKNVIQWHRLVQQAAGKAL